MLAPRLREFAYSESFSIKAKIPAIVPPTHIIKAGKNITQTIIVPIIKPFYPIEYRIEILSKLNLKLN